MFVNLIFVQPGKDGAASVEMPAIINTDIINMVVDNSKIPGTSVIMFKNDVPSGLVKGTITEINDIINRKPNYVNYNKAANNGKQKS